MIGHCVSVLLNALDSHKSKDVRRAACGSLLALTAVDSEAVMERQTACASGEAIGRKNNYCYCPLLGSSTDPTSSHCSDHAYSLRAVVDAVGPGAGAGEAAGSVFASFLPGIAMSLSSLVTLDAKVGQVSKLNKIMI